MWYLPKSVHLYVGQIPRHFEKRINQRCSFDSDYVKYIMKENHSFDTELEVLHLEN